MKAVTVEGFATMKAPLSLPCQCGGRYQPSQNVSFPQRRRAYLTGRSGGGGCTSTRYGSHARSLRGHMHEPVRVGRRESLGAVSHYVRGRSPRRSA